MEPTFHQFSELFDQLGLASDEASIRAFIGKHAPLPETLELAEAPFWTPAQAALLRDELLDDADWAEVVDQLNLALRQPA
ncbi:conserved hypothetical protein [Cupriavidus taiwanensis]|uniref:DUF2789 domain-containing protein n=1 Tax=Cupriavidus taiwanensis TaxID=164546 RepID=A0A375DWS1_9BURK|nr:DUF2789 domain-containing protein [Cupriavidus taiwanensis]NUO87525.1 DUF2789 domain-containing protein [Cupriavidus sp.]NUT13168.1 DUF2789 domain-containing protein [Cupriavidus sp.]SOZ16033.1 conserved hypothetical protein [Cupriavidus taiwanensis]SOZ29144.1 conserved hypothetical protein [Cupriavidus taiwanensis]SOZ46604.1 conserved hypothetical protein [Cupriavidus taiwanensis]